jgi:DNA-binding CsgD family transcriptional regulator
MSSIDLLIFENAPVGLIFCENRIIQRCNQYFADMFAGDRKHFENASLCEIYPSKDEFQVIGNKILKVMSQTHVYDDERIMRRLNKNLFWCRVRGHSLIADDPFAKTVWSFSDLSHERPMVELTRRERQVAMLLCEGRTTKQIADSLCLSPRTVDVYRANLLDKYGSKNIVELVRCLMGASNL